MDIDVCSTKYPIVMVHGMGFRDGVLCYWGRIPKTLQKYGAKVFFGNQDSCGSIETNAEKVKDSILKVLKETNSEKVNIIAHSKGGLESRYIVSSMGMEDKIASISTISTPHNGSVTIDVLMKAAEKFPKSLLKLAFGTNDLIAKIKGDKNPDTFKAVNQLTTSYAQKFNAENPDSGKIYYQSYSFVMDNPFSDIFMF